MSSRPPRKTAPGKKAAAPKKAKEKKTAASKKTAKSAANGASRAARYGDDMVIRLKVDGNPRRANTEAHRRFAKIKDGMTVGEFKKICAKEEGWNALGTLHTSVKRGQISVVKG